MDFSTVNPSSFCSSVDKLILIYFQIHWSYSLRTITPRLEETLCNGLMHHTQFSDIEFTLVKSIRIYLYLFYATPIFLVTYKLVMFSPSIQSKCTFWPKQNSNVIDSNLLNPPLNVPYLHAMHIAKILYQTLSSKLWSVTYRQEHLHHAINAHISIFFIAVLNAALLSSCSYYLARLI